MEGVKTIARVHPVDVIHHPAVLCPSQSHIEKRHIHAFNFWIGSLVGIAAALIALVSIGQNEHEAIKLTNDSNWVEYWNRSDMQLAFAEQTAIRTIEQGGGAPSKISRSLDQLDPQFRALVITLLDELEKNGYPFALLEGYRSPARQAELFTKEGARVTLAAPFQSKHQFGLAADLVALRHGSPSFDVNDPNVLQAYQQLGRSAETLGLVWGGRWTIGDYGHIESATSTAAIKTLRQRN